MEVVIRAVRSSIAVCTNPKSLNSTEVQVDWNSRELLHVAKVQKYIDGLLGTDS